MQTKEYCSIELLMFDSNMGNYLTNCKQISCDSFISDNYNQFVLQIIYLMYVLTGFGIK